MLMILKLKASSCSKSVQESSAEPLKLWRYRKRRQKIKSKVTLASRADHYGPLCSGPANTAQSVLNAAPSKSVYQQLIKRARSDNNVQPKNPDSVNFEIPESYRTFIASNDHVEQFLLHDSGVNDPER